jgi:membrane fusion protein (multidrug efflux system)
MNYQSILPESVCFLIALSFTISSCGDSNADQTTKKENRSEQTITVSVQELVPETFTERIQLTGIVKAYDDVMISPEEGGVVSEWKVEKGRYVNRGDVLLTLKDDVLRPSFEGADAQYKTSELTYEKQKKVFTEQAISEWQLRTSEYGRDAAKAQADVMRARLDRTQLRSPIEGILDDRFVDEGEMASPGVPIARVVNVNKVKILINVPERYAGTITQGARITMTVIAFPGDEFKGNISYIGATVSADNRTFPVEVVIPNPGRKLKPEMIGKAFILRDVKNKVLLVDGDVIQQVERQKYVVYVEHDGKAVERQVELGGHGGGKVEIIAGLQSGDRIITSGYQNIADGQPVRVAR